MKNYICSERADLFEPNIYINFWIQLVGDPKPEDVEAAVKAAFAANEATMSKVVLLRTGEAYYDRQQESGCRVELKEANWLEVLRQNEKIPFAINKGELMRVFILTAEEKLGLLIMAHHLVGDGKSITYFLEDIMRALAGESLTFKPMKLITKDALPKDSRLSLPEKLYANYYNWKWKHIGQLFQWEDYEAIHRHYWEKHSTHIAYEYFSTEEINRIHAHTKEMGVSINSYIAAAFLEAERKKDAVVGMAVDARIDGNKSMSNQATGISVKCRAFTSGIVRPCGRMSVSVKSRAFTSGTPRPKGLMSVSAKTKNTFIAGIPRPCGRIPDSATHSFTDEGSFDENVQLLHQMILDKLANPKKKFFVLHFISLLHPCLIDSVLLHTYGLYQNETTKKLALAMGYTGQKKRDLGITNLTRLDIPASYGKYGIRKLMFIPPSVAYSSHIIGVATMEDGMCISYHFMEEREEEQEKEREFFRRAIHTLKTN